MKLLPQICFFCTIFLKICGSSPSSDSLSCPMNMRTYLVDENSTEEVCDCKYLFLYHPKDDSCYAGYRQGPCPSGHYFILSPGETVAKCEKNPCHIDGLVPFEEGCYQLWVYGRPCENGYTNIGFYSDFQITCSSRPYLGKEFSLIMSKDCPENSYLTPTNKNHTHHFCKCTTTYVYSQKYDSCYRAYRQGPCIPGYYVVLPPGAKKPRCETNPCREDGLVPFQNGCHKIYETGPPCVDEDYELTVNETTFQLECIYKSTQGGGLAGGIITAPEKACPPGSRRIYSGCKKQFE